MMGSLRSSLWLAAVAGVLASCDSGGDKDEPQIQDGQLYPAVRVQDCDGNEIDFRAWLGQHDVSFVTFAAQWCVACQEEAPVINAKVVDGLSSQGDKVGVAQILVENQPGEPPKPGLCAAWRDDLEAKFQVLIDLRQENVEPLFGGTVSILPLHLVVTRDGIIRYHKLGYLPTDIAELIEGWIP